MFCSAFCAVFPVLNPSRPFSCSEETHRIAFRGSDAQTGAIGSSGSWAAVVPRVVDAYLAVLARNASKAAAENGRDADAGHVAGQAAAADVRVVHADLAFGAVDGLDAKAAAGLVGWQRQARGGLGGHQGGLRGPLADGGQSGGGSQEGEDGEGEITHGESRVGQVRDDPGEICELN